MKEIPMASKPSADELLFASGMRLEDYYISQTPVSEVICYIGPGEREYVLHIGDDELARGALARLKELGARLVTR
jgi:hypothetical protein